MTATREPIEPYGRTHNDEPGIRCWCHLTHVKAEYGPPPPSWTGTREQATFVLASNRYGSEAPDLLDKADKWPGTWHYTADRHRCVVKHMPAALYEVADCAESEDQIKALARTRRRFG